VRAQATSGTSGINAQRSDRKRKATHDPDTGRSDIDRDGEKAAGLILALHRFVIREKGKIGMRLNRTDKDMTLVERVEPGSLAEIYGLKTGDVLAKPGTDGNAYIGLYDEFIGGIKSGARPLVIEVLREIPQSNNAEVPRPTT